MRRAAATVILIWLPLCAAQADIYRSIDAQGHVQYSDTPSPGATLVAVTGSHTADTSDDSSNADALNKQGEQISQQLAQKAAASAVQKDTSAARAQQCKQAQDDYQKSIESRRLYKTGADGEREYLTDDEADQERVNSRLAMEAACKDTP